MRDFIYETHWLGYRFTLQHRSGGLWGRFGGGWNWALGFTLGSRTLILNLLVVSLRVERCRGLPP